MVQMPALNTPQFDWVKSRLPRKPQPVPPIYQPEVAAEAIVLGGRPLSPRVVCRRLDGDRDRRQQARCRASATGICRGKATTRSNTTATFRPIAGTTCCQPVDDRRDFGAHGDFDSRAPIVCRRWPDRRRGLIALAGAGAGCARLATSGRSGAWRGGLMGWSRALARNSRRPATSRDATITAAGQRAIQPAEAT